MAIGMATFLGGTLDLTRKPIDWPPPASYLAQVVSATRHPEFRDKTDVIVENAEHWQDEYVLLAATEDRKVMHGALSCWTDGNHAIYLHHRERG